jgi:hypothetical protein
MIARKIHVLQGNESKIEGYNRMTVEILIFKPEAEAEAGCGAQQV